MVACVDESGPHLFEVLPDANYYEYISTAIGARAQTAKTYLEKYFESFENLSMDELIYTGSLHCKHACSPRRRLLVRTVEWWWLE